MIDLFLLQRWYEERTIRERVLVCFFGFLCIYFALYLVLDLPLTVLNNNYSEKLNTENKIQDELRSKILVYEKIGESSIYRMWLNNKATIKLVETEYAKKVTAISSKELDRTIRLALTISPSIIVQSVKTEELKKSISASKLGKIHEQSIKINFTGTYNQTHEYLALLEKNLPYVKWRSLHYQLSNHPVANVELEFSVLYET